MRLYKKMHFAKYPATPLRLRLNFAGNRHAGSWWMVMRRAD